MTHRTDTTAMIDGRPAQAVDVRDRGLHYGDGLFETIAVLDGRALLWEAHMERLEAGCRRLGIEPVEPTTLAGEAAALCAGRRRAVLKLIVTRGAGGRGYRPEPGGEGTTRILLCYPHAGFAPEPYRSGVRLRLCENRLGLNPALAGVKHLNRLEQVLARREWDDGTIAEGVMRDPYGQVIEGTMSNLFVVSDGTLATPALARCGVAGVMRGHILELARRQGLPATEQALSLDAVTGADELFVCNSLIGIWPARRLEATIYDIGPVTMGLMEAVRPCSLMPGGGEE